MVAKAERDGNLEARERDREACRDYWYFVVSTEAGFSVLPQASRGLPKSDHGLSKIQLRLAVLAVLVGGAAS